MAWPDVNFERRVLTVPKSKHGEKRHIPLNSEAMAVLEFLLGSAANAEGPVFLGMRTHEPLQSNKHWFVEAVKKAGIRDFTWHDLRHTFGSRLAMAGVGLRTIQELMGHKTIAMTCRYAHLSPEHQLAAVEKLVDLKPVLPAPTDTTTDTGHCGEVPVIAARLQ
jgi:integrase